MGKYQKNIEAARFAKQTRNIAQKRTAALLLPLQMGSFTGTLKVWAATMLSTI